MINKLKIYTLAIIAGTFFLFSGCKSAKDVEEVAYSVSQIDYTLENALLWKVSGKSLPFPSYLYGTIHIIDGDDFFLPEGTLSAIEKSASMIFEIDMNEMNDMSSQMGMLKEIFMKDNQTLKDLLSVEDYKVVSDHFKKLGMPIFMLEKMKPMFLTVFASGDVNIGGLQNGEMKSYEMEFFEMAKQTNKKVSGLETMEFQMSMFDSIPYKVQADMLVESIQSSDAGSDQFRQMVDTYKAQNIDAMISMISDEEGGMKGFEDLLVDKRNMNWIPIMGERMMKERIFFAVGAGHLAGKNGVIHLLRKEGYKVTAVTSSDQID